MSEELELKIRIETEEYIYEEYMEAWTMFKCTVISLNIGEEIVVYLDELLHDDDKVTVMKTDSDQIIADVDGWKYQIDANDFADWIYLRVYEQQQMKKFQWDTHY